MPLWAHYLVPRVGQALECAKPSYQVSRNALYDM